jgi:hypothetical protein
MIESKNRPATRRRGIPDFNNPEYRQRRQAAVLRHIEAAEQTTQFANAILQAYKRETEPLCRYLRSRAPLTEQQRSDLADLIRRRLQRLPNRGHPKGPSDYGPAARAKRHVVYLIQKERKRLQRLHGKPLPKGMLDKVIDAILTDDDGYLADDLTLNDNDILQIRNTIRRGEKNKSK